MYACAAARYAVWAVECASRTANDHPLTAPDFLPVPPSDVLTLAQIHVSLLQIPDHAVVAAWRDRLPRENAHLASTHQELVAAMAAVESPATTFDEPSQVTKREVAYLLEAEFPATLHAYASACAYALAIMCMPNR